MNRMRLLQQLQVVVGVVSSKPIANYETNKLLIVRGSWTDQRPTGFVVTKCLSLSKLLFLQFRNKDVARLLWLSVFANCITTPVSCEVFNAFLNFHPPAAPEKVLVFYAKIDFALVIILQSGPGQYVNLFHAAGYGGQYVRMQHLC